MMRNPFSSNWNITEIFLLLFRFDSLVLDMHLIQFVLLGVLSQLLLADSVPFIRNPNCNVSQCESSGDTAIYYASQSVGNSTVHILFSSLDELTISIIETAKGYGPIFDYEALFAGYYNKTIRFNDSATVHSLDSVARNSFSLVLRRLIQFNDSNDNGKMDDDESATISYPLTNIATTNATFDSGNTNDPTFVMPLPDVRGSNSFLRQTHFLFYFFYRSMAPCRSMSSTTVMIPVTRSFLNFVVQAKVIFSILLSRPLVITLRPHASPSSSI